MRLSMPLKLDTNLPQLFNHLLQIEISCRGAVKPDIQSRPMSTFRSLDLRSRQNRKGWKNTRKQENDAVKCTHGRQYHFSFISVTMFGLVRKC